MIGKGTPTIYVNDRKQVDDALLSRLDPKDIISVRVITSHSAQYESSTKVILEIKTRTPEDGFGGSFLQELYATTRGDT